MGDRNHYRECDRPFPAKGFRISSKDFRRNIGVARRCFTKAQKLLILRRADYKCQYCGTPLTEKNFEADHKIPFSQAGATEVWNALALCASCNRHKSDKLIELTRLD
jgi:5-methylcytosine-specific restriction endonuclease McrA